MIGIGVPEIAILLCCAGLPAAAVVFLVVLPRMRAVPKDDPRDDDF